MARIYPNTDIPCALSSPAHSSGIFSSHGTEPLPVKLNDEGRTSHCAPELPVNGATDEDVSDGELISEPRMSGDLYSGISVPLSTQQKTRLSKVMQDEAQPDTPHARRTATIIDDIDKRKLQPLSGMPKIVQKLKTQILSLAGHHEARGGTSIHVYLEHDHDEPAPCILNPNGRFCRIWHISTAVVVVYIVGVVSFDLGFSWWKISMGAYIFNFLIDVYCWVDIAISFRTGFVHGGHLIMDSKQIVKHYLEFWFWIDFLASVPWELLLSVSKSNRKAVKFVKWLKLPRLLRLGRLRKLMKSHARLLSLVTVLTCMGLCAHLGACLWVFIVDPCAPMVETSPFDDWGYSSDVDDTLVMRHPQLGWECTQDNIWSIYIQALHTSVSMLLGVDRAGFGGYIAGGGESSALREEIAEYSKYLGVSQDGVQVDPATASVRAVKLLMLQRRYPLSLADSIAVDATLSSGNCTNPPNVNAEAEMNTYGLRYSCLMNMFGTLMLVLGCYLQGMLFANIAKLAIFRNAAESNFRQCHDEAKRELDVYGHLIPHQVLTRISKHFEFRWINQAYGPLQLLNPELLSRSLRAEIALYLYKDNIRQVEFLKTAPVEVLQTVCLNLDRQYFMQRDAIYRRGEHPIGMFIVDMGKVWVTSMDTLVGDTFEGASVSMENHYLEISPGEPFGVGAVVAAIQSTGGARVVNRKNAFAVTVCNTLALGLEVFRDICNEHPWFFKDLLQLQFGGDEAETDTVTPTCFSSTQDQNVQQVPSERSRFGFSMSNVNTAHSANSAKTPKGTPMHSPISRGTSRQSCVSQAHTSSHRSVPSPLTRQSVSFGYKAKPVVNVLSNGNKPYTSQDANLNDIDTDTKNLEDRMCVLEVQVKTNTEKVEAATNLLKDLMRIATTNSIGTSLSDQTRPYSTDNKDQTRPIGYS